MTIYVVLTETSREVLSDHAGNPSRRRITLCQTKKEAKKVKEQMARDLVGVQDDDEYTITVYKEAASNWTSPAVHQL